MNYIPEYKGYHTKVEYSVEDQVFYGKIEGIKGILEFIDIDAQQGVDFGNGIEKVILFNTGSSLMQYARVCFARTKAASLDCFPQEPECTTNRTPPILLTASALSRKYRALPFLFSSSKLLKEMKYGA